MSRSIGVEQFARPQVEQFEVAIGGFGRNGLNAFFQSSIRDIGVSARGIHSTALNVQSIAGACCSNPDNTKDGSYNDDHDKVKYVLTLLPQVFAWARSVNPSQPLTSGVWAGDWSTNASLRPIERIQLTQSDLILLHNYGDPTDFSARVKNLARFHRPVVCTEYMARPLGSTIQAILPIAQANQVGAMNWGFVAGKTQTFMPWDSWKTPYTSEPPVWFHDIFRGDGTPYRTEETDFIHQLLGIWPERM